jgi:hypothetical protein
VSRWFVFRSPQYTINHNTKNFYLRLCHIKEQIITTGRAPIERRAYPLGINRIASKPSPTRLLRSKGRLYQQLETHGYRVLKPIWQETKKPEITQALDVVISSLMVIHRACHSHSTIVLIHSVQCQPKSALHSASLHLRNLPKSSSWCGQCNGDRRSFQASRFQHCPPQGNNMVNRDPQQRSSAKAARSLLRCVVKRSCRHHTHENT